MGSAEGNTISYLSEICTTNTITAVEVSAVAMAELLELAKTKENIIPCLNDAHFPEKYRNRGSLGFAKDLMLNADVAVAPGLAFGEYGEGYVRIGLVENEHRIRQAAKNIKKLLS